MKQKRIFREVLSISLTKMFCCMLDVMSSNLNQKSFFSKHCIILDFNIFFQNYLLIWLFLTITKQEVEINYNWFRMSNGFVGYHNYWADTINRHQKRNANPIFRYLKIPSKNQPQIQLDFFIFIKKVEQKLIVINNIY